MNVLLTVDLNSVTSQQRENFYAKMKEMNWLKLKLTTSWKGIYNVGTTATAALQNAKDEVQQAARYAGISSYEIAAQAGTTDILVA